MPGGGFGFRMAAAPVPRRPAAEDPVPALAEGHRLLRGLAVGAQAADRGHRPDLSTRRTRSTLGPGPRSPVVRAEDRVRQRARLRVAEQVGSEQPERPVARDRQDPGRGLHEARREQRDAAPGPPRARSTIWSAATQGAAGDERRLADRDAARHDELAVRGERHA